MSPIPASERKTAAILGGAVLATTLLLAACGSDGAMPPGGKSESSTLSVTVPLPVTVPIPPAPAEPVAAIAPDSLVGQTADDVNAKLGQPSFARRDGPSSIWQYRGAGCVLDLFLYQAQAGAAPVVDHAELRPLPADGPRPDPACLQALMARAS
ncbi:MAG: hypothetical protein AB7G39_13160 [Alphaproteobacteria bacterium]